MELAPHREFHVVDNNMSDEFSIVELNSSMKSQ